MRRLLLLAAVGVTAGCGGSSSPTLKPLQQHGPIGRGARQVWFYAAKGKPRSLVIFLHGYGGPVEETPANHVEWLKHLAAEGSDVVYPRYEVDVSTNPYPDIDVALARARGRLGNPHVPIVVIGYSRGGRLAMDYSAWLAAHGHEPRLALLVYPAVHAPGERLIPLRSLDSRLKVAMMVGDKDHVVGGEGARVLLARLELANFPASRIKLMVIKSTRTFKATHLSVLGAQPGAKSEIWRPADQLIDSVR
ncbi:MAG: alpha/beta hydrolase [Gaiellaceae bacterium]